MLMPTGPMKTILLATASLLALASGVASAKGTTKTARKGDVASKYTLHENGGLFRQIGKNTCQVSTDVYDFKIAQHPDDPTAVYVIKKGGLFALVPSPVDRGATNCPPARLDSLVPGVDMAKGKFTYKVVD